MEQHTILIIDDDLVNREIVSEYLTNFGYRILQAENGEEGFNEMKIQQPDLVLLDVNMPGMDGFTTLQKIKQDADIAKIPVIFLTSYNRSNLKVKGLEMGAEDYITRPFDNTELLARIRVALRRSQPCPPCQKDENVMEGNIENINLVELLQTIELGNKNARIDIPELDIEVVLEEGVIVFCRFWDFKDYDALLRILLVDRGSYKVRFQQELQVPEKKKIKVTQAIMKLTAYLDEANSLLSPFGKWNYIKMNEAALQLEGAGRFGKAKTVPLKHFIIGLQGELKENLKKVWNMVQANRLELITITQ